MGMGRGWGGRIGAGADGGGPDVEAVSGLVGDSAGLNLDEALQEDEELVGVECLLEEAYLG
jgi:hypothetical protein